MVVADWSRVLQRRTILLLTQPKLMTTQARLTTSQHWKLQGPLQAAADYYRQLRYHCRSRYCCRLRYYCRLRHYFRLQ